jgi:hypothetical protein
MPVQVADIIKYSVKFVGVTKSRVKPVFLSLHETTIQFGDNWDVIINADITIEGNGVLTIQGKKLDVVKGFDVYGKPKVINNAYEYLDDSVEKKTIKKLKFKHDWAGFFPHFVKENVYVGTQEWVMKKKPSDFLLRTTTFILEDKRKPKK